MLFAAILCSAAACTGPDAGEPRNLDLIDAPRKLDLSWREISESAQVVVIGRVAASHRMARKAHIQAPIGSQHQDQPVELRLYLDRLVVEDWIRGAGPHTVDLYSYRIELPVFRAEYQRLEQKRLWFLRKDRSWFRPLADLGRSSWDLGDFPEDFKLSRIAGDGSGGAIAAALLDEELAAGWPSFPARLPELANVSGELLDRQSLRLKLTSLQNAGPPDVSRAACEQLYVLFDECRAGATRHPYFRFLDELRQRAR